MSRYLLINIGIIFFPLIFSFEKQVRFISRIKPVLFAQFTVGTIFIIWDSIAAMRGDWGFSTAYTHAIRLFYLPAEEYLFFITVSYSILFGYESLQLYFRKFTGTHCAIRFGLQLPGSALLKVAGLVIPALLLTGAIFNAGKYYTSTVLIFSAVTIITLLFTSNLYKHPVYLLTLLLSYMPFFVVNYLLTAPPIVWYSPQAIIGMRVTTIPVEDFFYSFTMITLWMYAYEYAKTRVFPRIQ